MKIYPLISAQIFRWTGLAQVIFLFLIWPLATICFGAVAPSTNTIPWSDNFENQYTNLTPLIDGTNGWYASSSICIVQTNCCYSGTNAAMLPIDVTLSNRFIGQLGRNVKLEMYIQPRLYDGTNYPVISDTNYSGISTNVAAQFFINSNGYFVVGSGTTWIDATNMPDGAARSITNINNSTNFVRIQINLQYNTHRWGLKAWTNGILVASTNYLSFTSNLNCFSGFDIYNGNATSYVDDVSVTRFEGAIKVNGLSFDTIRRINDAVPGRQVNGVNVQ